MARTLTSTEIQMIADLVINGATEAQARARVLSLTPLKPTLDGQAFDSYYDSEGNRLPEGEIARLEAELDEDSDEEEDHLQVTRTVNCTVCRRRQQTDLDVETDSDGKTFGHFSCEECGEDSLVPVHLRKGEVVA